jgi:hypothetical protein
MTRRVDEHFGTETFWDVRPPYCPWVGISHSREILRGPHRCSAIAVLKLSPRVENVIAFAQNIATALSNNAASFASPNPPLATFQADLAALVAAENAVLARTKGAVETRNAKLAIVHADLENLKGYVQTVANPATNTNAEEVIENAGMTVKKVTPRDKPALAVVQGSLSGSVELVAKAAASAVAYGWQYSTDQKTWTAMPMTMQAKTSASGFTPGTLYYFRVQALTRGGEQAFTQIVSLIVT